MFSRTPLDGFVHKRCTQCRESADACAVKHHSTTHACTQLLYHEMRQTSSAFFAVAVCSPQVRNRAFSQLFPASASAASYQSPITSATSKIHGLGAFAADDVKEYQWLSDYPGTVAAVQHLHPNDVYATSLPLAVSSSTVIKQQQALRVLTPSNLRAVVETGAPPRTYKGQVTAPPITRPSLLPVHRVNHACRPNCQLLLLNPKEFPLGCDGDPSYLHGFTWLDHTSMQDHLLANPAVLGICDSDGVQGCHCFSIMTLAVLDAPIKKGTELTVSYCAQTAVCSSDTIYWGPTLRKIFFNEVRLLTPTSIHHLSRTRSLPFCRGAFCDRPYVESSYAGDVCSCGCIMEPHTMNGFRF
jgi:hypothetical protein